MALKVKKTASVHVDEGEYKAIISNIDAKEGHYGTYYIWTFVLKGATSDGEPVDGICRLTGLTSDRLSSKSKMYKWAKAAGLPVEESDEIDLEDALKKPVRVYVEDEEDDEGRTWSKISKVRALRGKKAAVEEVDEEEDVEEEEAPKKAAKKAGKKKAADKKPAGKKPSKPKAKPAPVEEEEEDEDDPFEDDDDDDDAEDVADDGDDDADDDLFDDDDDDDDDD